MNGSNGQLDYAAFRKQYEQQHPASVPKRRKHLKREYPLMIELLVLLMFICAALLSGVHTVPTVYSGMEQSSTSEIVRQIVALLSFVAVELAIFMSAYLLDKQRGLAWIVLIATFLIAMISNLNSVNKALSNGDEWARIITITLGVGAPLIALMSGKLYIVISASNRTNSDISEQELEVARLRFDADVLEAWTKYEQRASRVSARMSGDLSAPVSAGQLADGRTSGQADNGGHATGQGYTKRTDARQQVRDYLTANPEQVNGNVRQIAALLQVGKSTVSEVQNEMRGGQNDGNRTVIDAAKSVIDNASGEAVQA